MIVTTDEIIKAMRTVLIITITLGILLPNFLIAQARMGYTESEIKADFKDKVFKSGLTNINTRYVYFEEKNATITYYFDENKLSNMCRVFTTHKPTLNALVEQYNREFVIISDTHWKYYTGAEIIYVDLVFKDGFVYFEFSI